MVAFVLLRFRAFCNIIKRLGYIIWCIRSGNHKNKSPSLSLHKNCIVFYKNEMTIVQKVAIIDTIFNIEFV